MILGKMTRGGDRSVLEPLAALAPLADRRAVTMASREVLGGMINPAGRVREPVEVTEQTPVLSLWARRDDTVAGYRTALRACGLAAHRYRYRYRYREIGASLAHMHCNRLFGVDRDRERAVYALLHGALTVRANGERYGQ